MQTEVSDGLSNSSGSNTDKNSVDTSNSIPTSSSSGSTQLNANVPENFVSNDDVGNLLPMILPPLAKLFETKLAEMEERICTRFSREIVLSEQRLAKLILERTGGSGNASIDEAELDLD